MATGILALASPLAASAKKASVIIFASSGSYYRLCYTSTAALPFLVVVARAAKVRGRLLISGEACLLFIGEVWRPEALRTSAENVVRTRDL